MRCHRGWCLGLISACEYIDSKYSRSFGLRSPVHQVRAQMWNEPVKGGDSGASYSGYTVFAGETIYEPKDYWEVGVQHVHSTRAHVLSAEQLETHGALCCSRERKTLYPLSLIFNTGDALP